MIIKSIYLQIYESYYDPEHKGGAHRSYKPIGYLHELQADGIDDPVSFYGEEVRKLNQEYKERKQGLSIHAQNPEHMIRLFLNCLKNMTYERFRNIRSLS